MAIAAISAITLCACSSDEEETVVEEEVEEEVVVTYYRNPVIDKDAPDPTVIRGKDGKFYAFSTMQDGNVPVYRSDDMVNWTITTEPTPRQMYQSSSRMQVSGLPTSTT